MVAIRKINLVSLGEVGALPLRICIAPQVAHWLGKHGHSPK